MAIDDRCADGSKTEMNYQERLIKAQMAMMESHAVLRRAVVHCHVSHDDWCGWHQTPQTACSCNPDIKLETPIGVFDVDRYGNYSRSN